MPCPDAGMAADTARGAPPPPPPPPSSPPPPRPPMGTGPCRDPVTVDVPAWSISNSGVYVRPGDAISIAATGRWGHDGAEVGPQGRGGQGGQGCPSGALGVRVGKFHDRQCVREAHAFTAKRAGYLWFFQSSGDVNAFRQTGALKVTIRGGDSCSGIRPEGMLSVFDDPAFDKGRLAAFEPVCGKIPVHFETDSPNDPRVKDYIQHFMGGDPQAFLRKAVLVGCAVNFPTPESIPGHYRNRDMRIVHYLGAAKFSDLGRPDFRQNGATYWDFDLSFRPDELADPGLGHYGRWGAVPSTLLHEMGHVLAPEGALGLDDLGGVPRWLQETYADLVATKVGEGIPSIDNPENWVLFGRQQPYCDGYQAGAPLLHTLEEEFPGFIHKLSAHILTFNRTRKWGGTNAEFSRLIGRDFVGYYTDYLARPAVTLKTPVAGCDFPD